MHTNAAAHALMLMVNDIQQSHSNLIASSVLNIINRGAMGGGGGGGGRGQRILYLL